MGFLVERVYCNSEEVTIYKVYQDCLHITTKSWGDSVKYVQATNSITSCKLQSCFFGRISLLILVCDYPDYITFVSTDNLGYVHLFILRGNHSLQFLRNLIVLLEIALCSSRVLKSNFQELYILY